MTNPTFTKDVSVTVPVSMPASLLSLINAQASADGVNRSALIRQALESIVTQVDGAPSAQTAGVQK